MLVEDPVFKREYWISQFGGRGKGLSCSNFDKLAKNQKAPHIVIPAEAGIQLNHPAAAGLDSRVRGSDGFGDFLRIHQILFSKFQAFRESRHLS